MKNENTIEPEIVEEPIKPPRTTPGGLKPSARPPTTNKPLIVPTEAGTTEVPREIAEAIKRTVAKNATDPELIMFLSVAKKYGLDPFAKEIWFIKYKDRSGRIETRVQTSRDGYLRIAQRMPEYRGMQSLVVHENDDFKVTVEDGEVKSVHHTFSFKDRGEIIGAWAVVRMGDEKVYSFVPFEEYYAGKDSGRKPHNPVWDKHPSAMIKKVAEADALKRAAGITGLVTAEEMGENPLH